MNTCILCDNAIICQLTVYEQVNCLSCNTIRQVLINRMSHTIHPDYSFYPDYSRIDNVLVQMQCLTAEA